MIYVRYVLLFACVCCCCLIGSIRGQSSESGSSADYEPEDDEFERMLNENNDGDKGDRMAITGRAREAEYDEFENFNEEFEKDKFAMDEKSKNKDEIEFQAEFDDKDDSKEKEERDDFYDTVKQDLDGDFNMYSSNKMNKRVKCENSEDCEEPNARLQNAGDLENNHLQNRSSEQRPISDDKTTIVYLDVPATDRPSTYTTKRIPYQHRQYEEATNLKVEHHDDDYWSKPLDCDCDTKAQPKIIGGSNVPKSRYPFAVAIFTLVGRGSFCGATLINEKYVITISFCLTFKVLNSISPDTC